MVVIVDEFEILCRCCEGRRPPSGNACRQFSGTKKKPASKTGSDEAGSCNWSPTRSKLGFAKLSGGRRGAYGRWNTQRMQQLGDDLQRVLVGTPRGRRPWIAAAVSVMVIGLLLLLTEIPRGPAVELICGYAATYVLVGLFMFGPNMRDLRGGRIVGFAGPGLVMVILWVLGTGYWGGLWLLGLPAWAIVCRDWTSYTTRQRIVRPLIFLLLLAVASAIFVVAGIYPNFSAFLFPLIPLAGLADPKYRARTVQAVTELALSFAVIAVAVAQPSSGWAWSPSYAGGAVLGCGLVLAGMLRWAPASSLPKRTSFDVAS